MARLGRLGGFGECGTGSLSGERSSTHLRMLKSAVLNAGVKLHFARVEVYAHQGHIAKGGITLGLAILVSQNNSVQEREPGACSVP